jgi:hypothetical protein
MSADRPARPPSAEEDLPVSGTDRAFVAAHPALGIKRISVPADERTPTRRESAESMYGETPGLTDFQARIYGPEVAALPRSIQTSKPTQLWKAKFS